MKALFLSALIGLAAFSARAIPVLDVNYTQSNWNFDLFINFHDDVTGNRVFGDLYLNGQFLLNTYQFHTYGNLPETSTLFNISGNNAVNMVKDGVNYDAPAFFITTPTGPRPADPVRAPDTGTTLTLLVSGLVGLHCVRMRVARGRTANELV